DVRLTGEASRDEQEVVRHIGLEPKGIPAIGSRNELRRGPAAQVAAEDVAGKELPGVEGRTDSASDPLRGGGARQRDDSREGLGGGGAGERGTNEHGGRESAPEAWHWHLDLQLRRAKRRGRRHPTAASVSASAQSVEWS